MIKLFHYFLEIARFLSVTLLVYVIVADKAFVKRQSLVFAQDHILDAASVACASKNKTSDQNNVFEWQYNPKNCNNEVNLLEETWKVVTSAKTTQMENIFRCRVVNGFPAPQSRVSAFRWCLVSSVVSSTVETFTINRGTLNKTSIRCIQAGYKHS